MSPAESDRAPWKRWMEDEMSPEHAKALAAAIDDYMRSAPGFLSHEEVFEAGFCAAIHALVLKEPPAEPETP